MQVTVFANRKGGVGKTTSVANFAVALGLLGKRVLAIDLDPQANLTESFGVGRAEVQCGVGEVLEDSALSVDDAVMELPAPLAIDLMPSSDFLAKAEIALQSRPTGAHVLKQKLKPVARRYDHVIIDTPPGIGTLVGAALVAADELVIPSTAEILSFNAVLKVVELVDELRAAGVNEKLRIRGVLLTMVQDRLLLTQETTEALKDFKLPVFPVRIPRSVRAAESPGLGRPIVVQQPSNKIAIAYKELAKSFLATGRKSRAA